MPSRKNRLDAERRKAKHEKEESQKVKILVFGLLDSHDVRRTEFDSAGPIHRRMMNEVGAIGWLAYNICNLNGRGKEFDRTIIGAKFLLLHLEDKCSLGKEEIATLHSQIEHSKRGNPQLMIFATPNVPIKGQEVTRIKEVEEISKYL